MSQRDAGGLFKDGTRLKLSSEAAAWTCVISSAEGANEENFLGRPKADRVGSIL